MTPTIYHLSWNASSFASKLRLFIASNRHESPKLSSRDALERRHGYSALSSTHYSIYRTAGAALKSIFAPSWLALLAPFRLVIFMATWLPLAVWCYARMLPLSDMVLFLAGGYEGMSADECDIRQCILRARRRYAEALECIRVGLLHSKSRTHTKALFYAALADVARHDGDNQEAVVSIRFALAEIHEAFIDPRQASRIYRQCAYVAARLGTTGTLWAAELRAKALALAKAADAKDQVLKGS